MTDKTYHTAARTEELPEGSVKAVDLAGTPVLLCHTKGQIFAVINRCSHAEEKLECGRMRSGWIACPVHGARFNLETGEPMNPPATEAIQTFETRVVGDMIEVLV